MAGGFSHEFEKITFPQGFLHQCNTSPWFSGFVCSTLFMERPVNLNEVTVFRSDIESLDRLLEAPRSCIQPLKSFVPSSVIHCVKVVFPTEISIMKWYLVFTLKPLVSICHLSFPPQVLEGHWTLEVLLQILHIFDPLIIRILCIHSFMIYNFPYHEASLLSAMLLLAAEPFAASWGPQK